MSVLTNLYRNRPAVRKAILAGLALAISASLGANAIIAGPIILAVSNYFLCGENESCKAEVIPNIPESVLKFIK